MPRGFTALVFPTVSMGVLELAGPSEVHAGGGALHTEDSMEGVVWVAGRVSPSRDHQPLGRSLPL